uniref:Immunoglobulin domain-containing protein n=1 Tax=Stegastes partitus TaxID=144197 RepID=A0A3B5AV18_9TELE
MFIFSIFETKTVGVGDDVILTCPRKALGSLFWFRLGSGNVPEVLGKTFHFRNVDHHIRIETKPGTVVLYINKAQQSDSAVYYLLCKTYRNLSFEKNNVTAWDFYFNFSGPEPAIATVPPSDPVLPGDPVTLQCSVLSDSDKKTCSGDFTVSCFRAGSDEDGDVCKIRPKAQSTQKCVPLSNTITSSEFFFCPVATCGEILFGNGTKLNINNWGYHRSNTILFFLCVALGISLITIAFFMCCMKACDGFNGK